MVISHAVFVLAAYSHLVGPTHVPHHYHEWDAIGYYAKIKTLCDTHVKNHRVRGTHKSWHYSRADYDEAKFMTADQVDVCGTRTWVASLTGTLLTGKPFDAVRALTPDAQHIWERFDRGVPFTLMQHHVEWNDSFGWNQVTFRMFLATQQFAHPMQKEKLVSHEPVVFEGRDALKLVTKWERQTTTLHLTQDTYQLLQQEHHNTPTKDAVMPDKVVTRVTYRDAGAKRYPTAHTTTIHHLDGTSRKTAETLFTEYAPHTPTADDHDLATRFGVTLLEHDPRPAVIPPPAAGLTPEFGPQLARPGGNPRVADEPPVDHAARYLIAGCAGVAVGMVLSFWMRGKSKT